jgi:nucleoside-diphosphate-sugar epimerase
LENLVNKKILITGSTGFVGSNLLRRLLESGNKDIFIFIRENSDLWRIKDILEKVNVYNVDLLDKSTVEKFISEIEPDIIFHNAAYGVHRYQNNNDLIVKTNFLGTVNVLEASVTKGFEGFINVGSALEYGFINKPFEEGDLPNPIDTYGVAKLASTYYCRMISITRDLPIVTLRLFYPYGYYEEPPRLIPYLIISMLKNRDIKLNSPNAKRDFIFIEEVIDAILKSAQKIDKIQRGTIMNIGSGIDSKVTEVFELLKKITGYRKTLTIQENLLEKDKLPIWRANINKALETIAWKPKYNLKMGLFKTVEWFKTNLNDYSTERIEE